MAKPTRKQPEARKAPSTSGKGKTGAARSATALKRKTASRPNILLRAASGVLRLALRNPAIFGGTAAFAVVFGFVAANALWYQPGGHPSPLMRTRLPFTHPDPARVSLSDPQDLPDPSKVTTFVIRREDEAGESEQERAEPAEAPAEAVPTSERTASVPDADTLATLPGEPSSRPDAPIDLDPTALVRAVQAELVRQGFYDGEADGRLGPKTTAAIRRFEQANGDPQTGIVSRDLLAALQGVAPERASTSSGIAGVRPAPRPTDITPAKSRQASRSDAGTADEIDPVAAAIRAAEGGAGSGRQPSDATRRATETASLTSGSGALRNGGPANPGEVPPGGMLAAGGSGMVLSIQRGLANLAYEGVTIDGLAGEQTRTAIRHFEKHYRLPETGEPSTAVLEKMKEIGAI